MNLEALSMALAAQGVLPDAGGSPVKANRYSSGRMMRWMSWGVIITFIGIFLGIVGKKFVHNDLISGAGALVAIAGIFLISFGSLPTLMPGRGKSRQTSKPSKSTAQAKPTVPLPLELPPESVSSVTENTTELLEVEKIKVSARPRN
jgi:hypothetical protein